MTIGPYSYDEYLEQVSRFHGHITAGMVMGGFMVGLTLMAHIGSVPVFGVPACVLYFKTTSLDLLLPRLLAGISVTRWDLAQMADGGFCLNCKKCTYPKCPFGK